MVEQEDKSLVRCNAALTWKRTEFDHDMPDALGGPATFDNARALCALCHRLKYPDDAKRIAVERRKTKKREAKTQGQADHRAPAVGLSEIQRRFMSGE